MRYETEDGALLPNPNGCHWCGIDRQEHFQRWVPEAGLHIWAEPTADQRKSRMLARRARGLDTLAGKLPQLREDVSRCLRHVVRPLQV